MATKQKVLMSLAGVDFSSFLKDEIISISKEMMGTGLHGLCFNPYLEGQLPGSFIYEEQIRKRMNIIRPYTKWVRSFSCTNGNEKIPTLAHELGLKTMAGAWLSSDRNANEREIENLVKLAKDGNADIIAVGNEVLYRKDLTEDELLEYMKYVKKAVPDIPMGYVDAYFEFARRPRITEACDVILANCFPFREGCDIDYSLLYLKDMYYRAVIAGNGKNVIITETGWPGMGNSVGGAVPSFDNAVKYFINTNKWAMDENIEMFYFSSFDEPWKIGLEGDVGDRWGIWDKEGNIKFK